MPSFLAMSAGAAAILARAKLLRQGVAARLFKYMFMKLKKMHPILALGFLFDLMGCQCSARNKDEKEKGLEHTHTPTKTQLLTLLGISNQQFHI